MGLLGGDPDALASRARRLYERGMEWGAVQCAGAALAGDPTHLTAISVRGAASDRLGRHAEALACWEAGLAVLPSADMLVNKSITLLRLCRFEEAADCAGAALEADPAHAQAYMNRIEALAGLSRYEEALECADMGLRSVPDGSDIRNLRTYVLAMLGRAPGQPPGDPGSLIRMAAAMESVSRHDKAVDFWNAELAARPGSPAALSGKAASLARMGRYGEALRVAEERISSAGQEPLALACKAVCLANLGDTEGARMWWAKARGADPGTAYALDDMPWSGARLGGGGDIEWFERAARRDPGDGPSRIHLCRALCRAGRTGEALARADEALAIEPGRPWFLAEKAHALNLAGRHGAALRCAEEAGRRGGTRAADARVAALVALGRDREALECCEDALRAFTFDDHAALNKAAVLAGMGEHGEAAAWYGRALGGNAGGARAAAGMARSLSALGRHEEALECIEGAEGPGVHARRGAALFGLGRTGEALAHVERALEEDPKDKEMRALRKRLSAGG
ncbi:MAG: tetratricopeptide repeat protein [Nitrosopumilus sp.]|nr:tetratricopeptide repeat protein [Nitrosopumilus sp.]